MKCLIKMNFTNIDLNQKKISVGLPVFNGEKFLRKKLNSIINQTHTNLELIISDNGSTDETQKICEEFMKKDNRIKYFHQEKNLGATKNYNFVLKKATGEYFLWTAVDDIILPEFIEKNIVILESNNNIVCSTSQVKPYGEKTDYLSKKETDSFVGKLKKIVIRKFTPLQNYSTKGTYEERNRMYLKLRGHQQAFYGIYRTDQIRKCVVSEFVTGFDLATMLNALKYGDFFVLDEVLTYRYDGGVSSTGFFNYVKSLELNSFESLFLYYPLTKWCWNNLGYRIFFKNLDCFIKLSLEGVFFITVDVIRKLGLGILVNPKKNETEMKFSEKIK